MRKEVLAFLSLCFIFLFSGTGHSQTRTKFILTQGQFNRIGGGTQDNFDMTGDFVFANDNSYIVGSLAYPPGIFTLCPADGCAGGQKLTINDQIYGHTQLRPFDNPVVVNGVNYTSTTGSPTFNESELYFDGGTIRIPYYPAKKAVFKLTYPATLTGQFNVSVYPGDYTTHTIFYSPLNFSGTVTLEFTRLPSSSVAPKYRISRETYNFPAAVGN